MEDFDCFLDADSGEHVFVDKANKLIKPQKHLVPYDDNKVHELITLINLGYSEQKALKELKLTKRVLNSWKVMNPEFSQEYSEALKSRVDHLLEETYEKDVQALYAEDITPKDVSLYSRRNQTVLNHVKHISPERFVTSNISLTQNNATLNINVPEGHEQQLKQFVGKLSHDGNFVPAGGKS